MTTPNPAGITQAQVMAYIAQCAESIIEDDLNFIRVLLTMARERVSDVVSRLERWAIGGFIVMFISGLVLFLGKPENYYTTTAFRIKMMMLPLAGLNVLFFHKRVYPHVAGWDEGAVVPWQGRLVGFVSMTLWLAIIIAGRWTAYFADPLYTAGFKR